MDINIVNKGLSLDAGTNDVDFMANSGHDFMLGQFPAVLDKQTPLSDDKISTLHETVNAAIDNKSLNASDFEEKLLSLDTTALLATDHEADETLLAATLPTAVNMHPAVQALVNSANKNNQTDLTSQQENQRISDQTMANRITIAHSGNQKDLPADFLQAESDPQLDVIDKGMKSQQESTQFKSKMTLEISALQDERGKQGLNTSELVNKVNALKNMGDKPIVNTSSAINSATYLQEGAGQTLSPLSSNSAASAATPLKLPTPVGDSAWRDAFAERITWMSNQSIKSASIQLNPSDLGPLEVTLKMQQQQASVLFTSHHAQVRDAIEDAMPRLRDMLSEQGFDLVDANVSEQGTEQQDDDSNERLAVTHQDDSLLEEEDTTPVNTIVTGPNGMVDYYA